MWPSYAVNAMMCGPALGLKKRFKEIIADWFIYADGMRPDELTARGNRDKDVNYFFENDLEK